MWQCHAPKTIDFYRKDIYLVVGCEKLNPGRKTHREMGTTRVHRKSTTAAKVHFEEYLQIYKTENHVLSHSFMVIGFVPVPSTAGLAVTG